MIGSDLHHWVNVSNQVKTSTVFVIHLLWLDSQLSISNASHEKLRLDFLRNFWDSNILFLQFAVIDSEIPSISVSLSTDSLLHFVSLNENNNL